jgi:cyclic pyranopterin phosphate synthase
MLKDNFSRKIDYLRISITDKCNLRCTYCMPQGVELLDHDEVLRNEEFVYFIRIFADLGIKKVRFTGGEPLVRKGFMDILAGTRSICPDLELCITTNGVLLDTALSGLRELGIKKLNISLDSLSREGFKRITRRDYFDRVISNIEKASDMDFFEIKINTVLHENILNELDDFLEYFKGKNVTLRFIEKMPFAGSSDKGEIRSGDLLRELEQRGNISRNGPSDTRVAMMYNFKYKDKYNIKIGIIPPISHSFCSRCNRLRLTCDGQLRACLHSDNEFDLKTASRMDMGREVIEKIIISAVNEKPERHNLDCDSVSGNVCASLLSNRAMSKIGG